MWHLVDICGHVGYKDNLIPSEQHLVQDNTLELQLLGDENSSVRSTFSDSAMAAVDLRKGRFRGTPKFKELAMSYRVELIRP